MPGVSRPGTALRLALEAEHKDPTEARDIAGPTLEQRDGELVSRSGQCAPSRKPLAAVPVA